MARAKAKSRPPARAPRGAHRPTLLLVIVSLAAGALLLVTPMRSSLLGQATGCRVVDFPQLINQGFDYRLNVYGDCNNLQVISDSSVTLEHQPGVNTIIIHVAPNAALGVKRISIGGDEEPFREFRVIGPNSGGGALCGNGYCNPTNGETAENCPADCANGTTCEPGACRSQDRGDNFECPEGGTGGPTGNCLRTSAGYCVWENRYCAPVAGARPGSDPGSNGGGTRSGGSDGVRIPARPCVVGNLHPDEYNAVQPAGWSIRVRGPCALSFAGPEAPPRLGPGVGNSIWYGGFSARRGTAGIVVLSAQPGTDGAEATLVVGTRSYQLVSSTENTPGLEGFCSAACMGAYDDVLPDGRGVAGRDLCVMDDRSGQPGGVWFALGNRQFEGDVYRACVEHTSGVFPRRTVNEQNVYCDPTLPSNAPDPDFNTKEFGFSRIPSTANPDLVSEEFDMLTKDIGWSHAQCGMVYCLFDGDAADPLSKGCYNTPLPEPSVRTWVRNNVNEKGDLPGGGVMWNGGGMYGPALLPPYGGVISDNQIGGIRREALSLFPDNSALLDNSALRNEYIASQLWGRVDATGADYADGSFDSYGEESGPDGPGYGCREACRQTGPNERR